MSPRSFSFSLAWDEDEGDLRASEPGDAEFLTTLNQNAHISLLKRIHIPKKRLRTVLNDVEDIVKQMAPFQVSISPTVRQSSSLSVIFLKIADNTISPPSSSSSPPTLTTLRSCVMKIFNDPLKLWSEDETLAYHPHLTLRRYCNPQNITEEAQICSEAIKDHVGPFRGQLGLVIRGITLFKDTRFGPRVV
ncbi:hypothetical protein R3P38DRAFT_3525511, partial [Favolaschia claudopus]